MTTDLVYKIYIKILNKTTFWLLKQLWNIEEIAGYPFKMKLNHLSSFEFNLVFQLQKSAVVSVNSSNSDNYKFRYFVETCGLLKKEHERELEYLLSISEVEVFIEPEAMEGFCLTLYHEQI